MKVFFNSFVVNPLFAVKFRQLRDIHWWARLLDILLKISFVVVLVSVVLIALDESVNAGIDGAWLIAIYTLLVSMSTVPVIVGLCLLVYRLTTYLLVYVVFGSKDVPESQEKYTASLEIYLKLFWYLLLISIVGFSLLFLAWYPAAFPTKKVESPAIIYHKKIDFGFGNAGTKSNGIDFGF